MLFECRQVLQAERFGRRKKKDFSFRMLFEPLLSEHQPDRGLPQSGRKHDKRVLERRSTKDSLLVQARFDITEHNQITAAGKGNGLFMVSG